LRGTDKRTFLTHFTGMCEVFDKTYSENILNIYYTVLEKHDIEKVIKAIDNCITQLKFFPKPAELIEMIENKPKTENKALFEANKIIEHLNIYGKTKLPEILDPITKHLMTSRWKYKKWAAEIIESEIKWWVKEFCAAYVAYQDIGIELLLTDETSHNVKKLTENIGITERKEK